MWSHWDTLLLITGILFLVCAVLPFPGVPGRYRGGSAAVGAGLVLVALVLGSLQSFTYPSVVEIGPAFPVIWAVVMFIDGRRRVQAEREQAAARRTSLTRAAQPAPAACRDCSEPLEPGQRFCTACGAAV
jgi:hypothetical protein